MNKLIFNNNYKILNTLFNERKFENFEKKFKELDSLGVLCEKSYNLYAVYLFSNNELKKSLFYLKKSLDLNPHYTPSKINMGAIYFKSDQILDAEKIAIEVEKDDPKNKSNLYLLSEVYIKKNDLKTAKVYFDKILDTYPTDFNAYFRIGMFYFNRDEFEIAEEYFRNSVQLNNSFVENEYFLALTLKKLKKFDDAIGVLRNLVSQNLKVSKIYYLLSDILRGLGEVKKSNEVLMNYLEKIDPNDPISISRIIISPMEKKKKDIFVANVINSYSEQNDLFKERVGFSLFNYFDGIGDYKRACDYLKISLNIIQKKNNYNFKVDKDQFSFLKEVFNRDFFDKFENKHSLQNSDKVHFFIVGLHRSGSTLLEQMLSMNKKFTSYGELPYFADLISKYFPNQELNVFKKDLLNFDLAKYLHIGEEYKKKINLKTDYSIDKMLSNFRMMGLISVCIPNSIFIHTKRNKNDNLISILSNYYEDNSAPWSYNEKNLIDYYGEYEALMSHWKSLIGNRIIEIQYEELINKPKEEISKILNFLKLKWDDNYLNFTENNNLVETASIYQVREKLYNKSIDRWLNYKNYFDQLFK